MLSQYSEIILWQGASIYECGGVGPVMGKIPVKLARPHTSTHLFFHQTMPFLYQTRRTWIDRATEHWLIYGWDSVQGIDRLQVLASVVTCLSPIRPVEGWSKFLVFDVE